MAFVASPYGALGAKSFSGAAISRRARANVASIRMADDSETAERKVVTGGKTMWKENYFTGGFPGGEQFFQAWMEDGMKKDVPDMPSSMQPSKKPGKNESKPKEGLLAKLDATEFFSKFQGSSPEETDDASDEVSVEVDEAGVIREVQVPTEAAPAESLYEAYFPADRRNLAPDIKIVYEKDFVKDKVGVAMTEVTASPVDLYYPKETKNKAPVIKIQYTGALAGSSVTVALEEIEPLPNLPPPPKKGDAVTVLAPGRGGGLKLEYSIAGEGQVNI